MRGPQQISPASQVASPPMTRSRRESPVRAPRPVPIARASGAPASGSAAGAPASGAPASGSAAGGSNSGWVLSTSAFTNQYQTQPYVGNGYLSQRIPAAGMGFAGGLGTVGWPLRTPRVTDAMAAGVYAYTDASNVYPGTP